MTKIKSDIISRNKISKAAKGFKKHKIAMGMDVNHSFYAEDGFVSGAIWAIENLYGLTDLRPCDSCCKDVDSKTMKSDGDDNWFCPKCWKELSPVMKSEYKQINKNK